MKKEKKDNRPILIVGAESDWIELPKEEQEKYKGYIVG